MLSIEDFYDLENRGLVISRYKDNKVLFKYHNSVFYKNLWDESSLLLEARGIVFDKNTGATLQRPFHKIFNVGENGQEEPANRDRIMKVNGFMCAATVLDGYLFVTTTGSMSSSYQELACQWVNKIEINSSHLDAENCTFLFEVCDHSDPHIVDEDYGIYLLSIRDKETGAYVPQEEVDLVADSIGAMRPSKELSDEKEGWVYYDKSGTPVAKTKTPYYLSKKALMRMGKKQTRFMFNNSDEFKKRLDEEFYSMFEYILSNYTQVEWFNFNEQDRRSIIEGFFNE